jgi:hypothetical protein
LQPSRGVLIKGQAPALLSDFDASVHIASGWRDGLARYRGEQFPSFPLEFGSASPLSQSFQPEQDLAAGYGTEHDAIVG